MATEFQGTTLQSLDNLSSLLLSYNARSEGPCDIGRMTQLTSLSLMGNHEKCPHLGQLRQLGQLTGLTRLCLYDNTAVTGEAFDRLTGLTELTLEGNHSESVETSLTRLANLDTLLLTENKRTSHETLSRLTALTSLSLEGNWMVTDAALVTLTNLRTLDLRSNTRITLEALRNLPRLTELRVSHGKSAVVPEHFYRDAERTRDHRACQKQMSNFFHDKIPSLVQFNIG
jgi:internalin A